MAEVIPTSPQEVYKLVYHHRNASPRPIGETVMGLTTARPPLASAQTKRLEDAEAITARV